MLSLRLFRRLGSQSVATSKTIARAHLWSHNPRSLVSSSAHFSTSIRRRSDNRYNLASPKNDIVKEDPETTTSQALPGRAEPRLSLTFTCTVTDCGERSTHEFSKRAYTKGIVLVQCPKCKNRHLIADHLGWFKDSTKDGKLRTVEDIVRERGETVKKGRLTVGGDIEHAQHVALSGRHLLSTQTRSLKNNLRELFRNIAQPVAVVTSFMPDASSSSAQNKFHGATLSSFTSIAMDPYPLVAFALRIPSRMATTLSSLSASSPTHMVVNLLSAHQSSTAIMFSRPDLHPVPFESPDVQYELSEEGLPVLKGVVGALSCKLVRRGIPLHDLEYLGTRNGSDLPKTVALETGDATSELFIARVVRVESIAGRASPLVYYQRGYTTCPPKP